MRSAFKGLRLWWNDLDRAHKIGVLTLVATLLGVIATIGAGAGWFTGAQEEAAIDRSSSTLPGSTATSTASEFETTSTSLTRRYEYDPSLPSDPEDIWEGESHVFFQFDGDGLTVQIGPIDDEFSVAETVTVFVTGEPACRWSQVGTGEGRLAYRPGEAEYEITVDVPTDYRAAVRVARLVSGEQTGTALCEPAPQ
jgi:hypothetical protein